MESAPDRLHGSSTTTTSKSIKIPRLSLNEQNNESTTYEFTRKCLIPSSHVVAGIRRDTAHRQ